VIISRVTSSFLRVASAAAVLVGLLAAPRASASPTGADDSPYMDSVGAALPGPQWVRADYERAFTNDEWAGIRWAYVWVSWSDIERTPGMYDFTGLDGLVASARRHRLQLMMQVQTGGDFVLPGPAQLLATGGYRTNSMHPLPTSSAPRNMRGPMAFWRVLARRYMPDGGLAKTEHWADGYGVRFYEVENEPDSLPWITGSWSTVPKDYALYVSYVSRTLKAVSPSLRVVGPALSTGPDGAGCCSGISWLDQILGSDGNVEWASDTYRADVAAGQVVVGAGAYIDVFSFHDDFADAASAYSVDRARTVWRVVRRHAPRHRPVIWETEGAPLTRPGDDVSYARAQAQVTIRLIAAGVTRLNFDASSLRGDSPQERSSDPAGLEARALTTYFPSSRRVVAMHLAGGVESYSWTNPQTGLRSVIVWAMDEPARSGAAGRPFTVSVPIRTAKAVVVSHDWRSATVRARGRVAVDLERADPSPVVIVAETR
jgi:hypothetical protein